MQRSKQWDDVANQARLLGRGRRAQRQEAILSLGLVEKKYEKYECDGPDHDGHAMAPRRSGSSATDVTREETMNKIAIAALAGTALLFVGAANAQVDFSKVEINTIDLGNKTYMLTGQGGNITVAVGTDGIIMVDSQFAPLHDKIKAAIAKISPLPVKYIINTHYHGDHVEGNDLFQKEGAIIVGHDNLRVRLAAGTTNMLTGNKTPPAPAARIPTLIYQVGDMKVQVGGRVAELRHVINAHTDTDTWVYFPDANVL